MKFISDLSNWMDTTESNPMNNHPNESAFTEQQINHWACLYDEAHALTRYNKAFEAPAWDCHLAGVRAIADAVAEPLQQRITELESLVYVPNEWKCKECGFSVVRNVITPTGIFGDGSEIVEPCPNDGMQMFRVSWKEDAMTLAERLSNEIPASRDKDARIAELSTAIRSIDALCSRAFASAQMEHDFEQFWLGLYDIIRPGKAQELIVPEMADEHNADQPVRTDATE